jgi:ATP-dependent DNA helicase RecG
MFTEDTLLSLIEKGEDAFTQFKVKIDRSESLAKEMVAFANSEGGNIIIGVADDKNIVGIQDIGALNQLISNTSTENCVPPIHTISQNLIIDQKLIVIISVPQSNQKPYRTKTGEYLIKSGADKRQMSTQELQRTVLQSAGISTEELPIHQSNFETDIDKGKLYLYFEKENQINLPDFLVQNDLKYHQLLKNLNIVTDDHLNLVGLLYFGKSVERFRPMFMIKAVNILGNDFGDTKYISNDDIYGTLDQQYTSSTLFINSQIAKIQKTETFNSLGVPEISPLAVQEAIANALVHRDYSIQSSVRVFLFTNRLEIISPGCLPNHLSVEKIKMGTALARNPIIHFYASKILPYRGLGTGIKRILKEHPNTDFINDRDGHQFKVIMWRD